MDRIIAVDFDGCLCENKYPEIGEEHTEVLETLRREKANGSKLILWTCREDEKLHEAVKWCDERGIHFDCLNNNLLSLSEKFGNNSRKVCATEYWDDRAVRMPFNSASLSAVPTKYLVEELKKREGVETTYFELGEGIHYTGGTGPATVLIVED
jgi:hypothetical protein